MCAPASAPGSPVAPSGFTAWVVAALLSACTPAAPAPEPDARPEVPPGVVLLVDGLPLARAEVSPLTEDILELFPEYSELHARRLALTNVFLPRLAARAAHPDGWNRAREACLRSTQLDARARTLEGGFQALGVGLWSLARHLPVGSWSEPLELPGRWLRLRLEAKTLHEEARLEALRLSLVEFAFLAPEEPTAGVEAAVDRAVLTLVDPAFAEAVPEAWKHRMHATTR